MQKVRLRVVLPAILGGALLLGALLGGGEMAYLLMRSPDRAFREQWDSNTAATAPAVYPAIQADPVLRQLMVDKSAAAFAQGGWPAAKTIFHLIVNARITAFAGDDTILACQAAWRDVYAALQPTPRLCDQFAVGGADALPKTVAVAEIAHANQACNAAIADGGQRRLGLAPPDGMSAAEYSAAWLRAMDDPKPLTTRQRSVMNDGLPADDPDYCTTRVAFADNIAALPRAEAARFARDVYANQGSGGFDYTPPAPSLPAGEPPADFTCAPAGTRFVLTMEATATGLPIVWESLGQKGWDCRIRSTVSGEHSIWNWTANDDQANTLRQLWPLQVGKRAGSRRVVSYGPYWLPWGTVNAYAIEETTNDKAGAPWYRSTVYWAPSLGFEIGRHMQVLHGAWPDDAGPDFQTVAMLPPGSS